MTTNLTPNVLPIKLPRGPTTAAHSVGLFVPEAELDSSIPVDRRLDHGIFISTQHGVGRAIGSGLYLGHYARRRQLHRPGLRMHG